MKSRIHVFGWGAATLVLILCLSLFFTAGLKHYLISHFTSDCPSCQVRVESLSLTGAHSISLEHISLNLPLSEHARITGSVASLALKFQLSSFLTGLIVLQEASFLGADLEVTEGPSVKGKPHSDRSTESKMSILLKQVSVHEGRFRYVSINKFGNATLTLSDIESSIESWLISEKRFSHDFAIFNFRGKLEKSGNFRIHCRFSQDEGHKTDHIFMNVTGLPLSEMNAFFEPQVGAKVEGLVEELSSKMRIQNNQLKGHLKSQYKGLYVQFNDDARRSEIGTLLQNLVSALTIDAKKSSKDSSHIVPLPGVIWEDNQSIFNFLLSGLKPAALELMSN